MTIGIILASLAPPVEGSTYRSRQHCDTRFFISRSQHGCKYDNRLNGRADTRSKLPVKAVRARVHALFNSSVVRGPDRIFNSEDFRSFREMSYRHVHLGGTAWLSPFSSLVHFLNSMSVVRPSNVSMLPIPPDSSPDSLPVPAHELEIKRIIPTSWRDRLIGEFAKLPNCLQQFA